MLKVLGINCQRRKLVLKTEGKLFHNLWKHISFLFVKSIKKHSPHKNAAGILIIIIILILLWTEETRKSNLSYSNRWQWNTRIFPVTKILYPVKIQCFTVHLFHVNTSRPSRFHQSKPIGNYHNSFTFFLLNFLHILRGIHTAFFMKLHTSLLL